MEIEEILKLAKEIRQAESENVASIIILRIISDSWQKGFAASQEAALKTIEIIIK